MRTNCAFLFGAFLAALCLAGPAAHAQSLDLSRMTCKEFLDSDKVRKDTIIAWLDGYYLDQNTTGPVMRFDKFAGDLQKLTEYCTPNPALELIDAADTTIK
jgi:HdeA/HdeB family